jgi:hypothetical protein
MGARRATATSGVKVAQHPQGLTLTMARRLQGMSKTRLTDLGVIVAVGSSADFGKFTADETEKWAKVVKFAGIKAD